MPLPDNSTNTTNSETVSENDSDNLCGRKTCSKKRNISISTQINVHNKSEIGLKKKCTLHKDKTIEEGILGSQLTERILMKTF